MAPSVMMISNRNHGAWALRGWLMAKLAGLKFTEKVIAPEGVDLKDELQLVSGVRVPSLQHQGVTVWDTLAIGEYLHEIKPEAQLLPADIRARAHCRAICGEMHSGFSCLRSSMPMDLQAHFPGFKVWSGAQAEIDHVLKLWRDCLSAYGGPYLFGQRPGMADAMYAPMVTRFLTYDVAMDEASAAYCQRIMALPAMKEWVAAAKKEIEGMDPLESEF
jgi:glutathione S-transferase